MDNKTILKRLGFEEVHTGGGCTALQKCFSDGTGILITDGDASTDNLNSGLVVGFENADGEPELQVEIKNAKNIIKFVQEGNRFTEGLERILNSKFQVSAFKNYDLDDSSHRSGWTANLWRLGHTAHVARLDNDGTPHGTKIDYVGYYAGNGGEESFLAFCNSLPKYTQKERWLHYGITEDYKIGLSKNECIFTEEVVVDLLATEEDQKQKEAI
tara:strand:- start:143 stop:784 length:642 start_codon:yes stop_codon:yes gene_type:complete